MAGVSTNKRDVVFQRDREWSTGGASIFSNNFLTTGFSFINQEGFGAAVPGNGCNGEGFFLNGSLCAYDFTLQAADEAETENQSLFTRARYDINADWSLYLNGGVSRVTSFGRYAPVPSSPWLVGGFGAIVISPGLPNHPATPPDAGGLNPEWEAYQDRADETLLLTHRFAANGPRDTSTDAQVYDIDIGAQGRAGPLDIDFGVRRTESQYFDLGRNYIVFRAGPAAVRTAVLTTSTTRSTCRRKSCNRSHPPSTATHVTYRVRVTHRLPWTCSTWLPARSVSPSGGEWRDEQYKDIYDDLQANGNITGSAGNSAFGDRESWALFAEAAFPRCWIPWS